MLCCVRTTLRIEDGLARRAKERAAADGITLTAMIEQALREALARRDHRPERPKLPAEGGEGVAPGIDLRDGRALRDRLDGLTR